MIYYLDIDGYKIKLVKNKYGLDQFKWFAYLIKSANNLIFLGYFEKDIIQGFTKSHVLVKTPSNYIKVKYESEETALKVLDEAIIEHKKVELGYVLERV